MCDGKYCVQWSLFINFIRIIVYEEPSQNEFWNWNEFIFHEGKYLFVYLNRVYNYHNERFKKNEIKTQFDEA